MKSICRCSVTAPRLLGICILVITFLSSFCIPSQGKFASAELLLERSLAICEKSLDPEHPDVAESLYKLAMLSDLQVNAVIHSPG